MRGKEQKKNYKFVSLVLCFSGDELGLCSPELAEDSNPRYCFFVLKTNFIETNFLIKRFFEKFIIFL